ncbi:TIGR02234 family membrane protein [Gordonia shandongensis]|uniref:TIGR02234 family membrane protein n=1 Tax=Gordonia shandongensis TaxID=376351 RepID=UPI0003FCA300|nr:TIGR02234 family membrane protein [Gordonia shandongensis]
MTSADPTTPDVPEPGARPAAATANRRWQLVALVLLLLAAAGLWGASQLTWAQVLTADRLGPPREWTVTGATWSPLLLVVPGVIVAAALVQFALRGWALRAVAILVAILAVLAAIPAISLLTDGEDNMYVAKMVDLPSRAQVTGIPTNSGPGFLVIAAVVAAVVGAVAMARTARDPGMSSKYSSPAARRAELERRVFADRERAEAQAAAGQTPTRGETESNERLLWDSLDEGIDPTDDEH